MEVKSKKHGKTFRKLKINNTQKQSRKCTFLDPTTNHRYLETGHRYYGTDEEDYSYQALHRYSATSFPLFSNLSDDEVVKKSTRTRSKTRERKSKQQESKKSLYNKTRESKIENVPIPLLSSFQKNSNQGYFTSGTCYMEDFLSSDPQNKHFPFQSLPNELKLKVMSYLTQIEKGLCMRVCKEWKVLMMTPSLWTQLCLSDFPLTCVPTHTESHPTQSPGNCYSCYKQKVHSFFEFLLVVNPSIRKLDFKFDIAEAEDQYLPMLQTLMCEANLSNLQVFNFNWKDTPLRPFWLEQTSWHSCNDVMSKLRYRSRIFTYCFDDLTKISPKISILVLPFDWSRRNVESLTRLTNLHTLVAEKYFVFQVLEQELLDKMLDGLPRLKRLMLEVWSPSGPGLVPYSFSSQSLEYLDMSQSRGLYLQRVNLPNMKRFRVARHPWNGPLVCADKIHIPCLYDVLAEGAPKLCKINDHYLQSDWNVNMYSTLEEVLKGVCSCRRHKTGWAM